MSVCWSVSLWVFERKERGLRVMSVRRPPTGAYILFGVYYAALQHSIPIDHSIIRVLGDYMPNQEWWIKNYFSTLPMHLLPM
jgi:hypothetical protein